MADRLAGEFGRIEGADVDVPGVDEIVGGAAVEGFLRLWDEKMPGATGGGATQVGQAFEFGVETLPIVRGDVLDVRKVLESTFDLERADAGVDQGPQVVALVVVLERQEVFVFSDDAALGIA